MVKIFFVCKVCCVFLRDRSGVGLRHIKFKMFIRYSGGYAGYVLEWSLELREV